MKILLDTNALLWQIGLKGGERLGRVAKRELLAADVVYVSAISIVELQIKTMNGKLDAPSDTVKMVQAAGNTLLPLSGRAGDALRNFPQLKRHDPFDRMLLAQASIENLQLLTADDTLLELGLPFVADARV